jgi:hypothetical protein
MGKGLLAWWRRRIVARGLAGAVLFAVPVAVAALIGFGTSISGVAGGLSAVTKGPNAVPASAQSGPNKLNHAVVALANRQKSSTSSAPTGGGGSAGGGSGNSTPDTSGTGTGTGSSTGSSSGSTGSSGGGPSIPTINTPTVPNIDLSGGGSTGGATDGVTNVNDTVNNVIGGVDNTVNGLLGGK